MQLDAIWKRARADLILPAKQGSGDVFLWEHADRVARSALSIAKLPELAGAGIEQPALAAAALYHDAAWIVRCKDGEIGRLEILLAPAPESTWELSATTMERSLVKLLPTGTLRRAAAAIRSLARQGADSAEGRIIVDANSLDEFGLVSLWGTVRRGMLDGKGVQAAIDMWQRKREYQFWSARLQDSFHLPAVRQLAEQRLRQFEQFMEELALEQSGFDVERLVAQASAGQDKQPTK